MNFLTLMKILALLLLTRKTGIQTLYPLYTYKELFPSSCFASIHGLMNRECVIYL